MTVIMTNYFDPIIQKNTLQSSLEIKIAQIYWNQIYFKKRESGIKAHLGLVYVDYVYFYYTIMAKFILIALIAVLLLQTNSFVVIQLVK